MPRRLLPAAPPQTARWRWQAVGRFRYSIAYLPLPLPQVAASPAYLFPSGMLSTAKVIANLPD